MKRSAASAADALAAAINVTNVGNVVPTINKLLYGIYLAETALNTWITNLQAAQQADDGRLLHDEAARQPAQQRGAREHAGGLYAKNPAQQRHVHARLHDVDQQVDAGIMISSNASAEHWQSQHVDLLVGRCSYYQC
jgi:hypothetical protein